VELVLSTNGLFATGGSETYLVTVAAHLQRLGHGVTVHANELAPAMAEEHPGLRFAVGDDGLPGRCDAILVQDAICAYQLAERLPGTPQVFVAHSTVHDVQLPPQLPGVCAAAVALNERVAERLHAQAVPLPVVRLRQPVDLDVFGPRVPPRPRAERVLALGNNLEPERQALLAAACAEAGLELEVRGSVTQAALDPAALMLDADVVVGYGRCVVEAMACGRAAYVWDHLGGDGWVTAASYAALEADGFGGRATGAVLDAAAVAADLRGYDPAMGMVNRELAVRNHGPRQHAQALAGLLRDAAGAPVPAAAPLAELGRATRLAWDAERRVIGLARELERQVADARAALQDAAAQGNLRDAEIARLQAETRTARAEAGAARAAADALRATRRYKLGTALARPLDRARDALRRGAPEPAVEGTPEPAAGGTPGPAAGAPGPAGGAPELAVVVFSYQAPPGLARTVRSVLDQGVPVELLVINSGGGDAPGLLSAEGFDVRVMETPERLFPGAACNVGLRETTAPYVAFVAGDLVLQPGWAAGRLARHRSGVDAVAAALVPLEPAGPAASASYLLLNHRRTPWTPPGEALRFSLSYDRSLFDRYGTFRDDLRTGEDADMQRRFGPEVQIEFAPDVRAAHPGPDRFPAMLAEHFARGRRMAYARAWTEAADWRPLIARRAFENVPLAARAGWAGAHGVRGRARVAAAAPLLLPAATAYAAGALTAPLNGARRWRRQARLLALITVKDDLRFLPGLIENLRPHVDGIVAFDNGCVDGSAEFLAAQPEVIELLTGGDGVLDDAGNHERLVRAAWEHGPDWLLGIDADERVERHFRQRAERVFARAGAEDAYFIRIREVWDRPDRVRVDGVWGRKRKAALFRARRDHAFDDRQLHGHWAPLNDHPDGVFPTADLLVYHLRMLHADDREARRRRYETLDPEQRFQEIGYGYLTSVDGLSTAPLPYGRDYAPLPAVTRSGPSRSSAPGPAPARRSPVA
jgi:GT2 family glycosyltransferase